MPSQKSNITEGLAWPADREQIERALVPLNRSMAGPSGYMPFSVILRGEAGVFLGGAIGSTFYGWAFVEMMTAAPQAAGKATDGRSWLRSETLRESVHASASGSIPTASRRLISIGSWVQRMRIHRRIPTWS